MGNGLNTDKDQLANVPLEIQDGRFKSDSGKQKGMNQINEMQHFESYCARMSSSVYPNYGSYTPTDIPSSMKAEIRDPMPSFEHQRDLIGLGSISSSKTELACSKSEATRDYHKQQKNRQILGSLEPLKSILKKPKVQQFSYPSLDDLVGPDRQGVGDVKD
ncbi:hypothetical protein Nepgr_029694 [Nepenthes gracilis]|uniref:Uncharacterized protein n=1 Tax=Nepenthes gracilis TaxID=150966 RepID=A0AAD3TES5_NEPGR|nr:hypothetical protein Nepgr_029694 [Nepenthes gracilis]